MYLARIFVNALVSLVIAHGAFRWRDFQRCGHDDIATGLIARARKCESATRYTRVLPMCINGSARARYHHVDEINPSTRREFFKCWEKEKRTVATFSCSQRSRLLCPLVHIASACYRIREQHFERDKCSSAWIALFCFCRRYLYAYVLIVALETQRLKKIQKIQCCYLHRCSPLYFVPF